MFIRLLLSLLLGQPLLCGQVEVSAVPRTHLMVRVKVTADVVRARAADVLQDGSYCGLFELTVLAAWKNVKVLLVFGTHVLDVYDFFGKGLPPLPDRPSRPVMKFVVVQAKSGGVMMSADEPGSFVPDMNHFMIGRTKEGKVPKVQVTADYSIKGGSVAKVKVTAESIIPKLMPDGGRRKAADVARDLHLSLRPTNITGDCLIDAVAYFLSLPRNAITWKRLRRELSEHMGGIADDIEAGRGDGWAACFRRKMTRLTF